MKKGKKAVKIKSYQNRKESQNKGLPKTFPNEQKKTIDFRNYTSLDQQEKALFS